MDPLQQLLAAMKKCLNELDACSKSRDEAKDEAGKNAAEAAYKAKAAEYDAFNAKIEEAKAHIARKAKLDELQKLAAKSQGDEQTQTIPTGTPAEAKNHQAEDVAHRQFVCDFFNGKSLSGQARDLLAPRTEWKQLDRNNSIRLSKSVVDHLFFGKALPLTTNSGSEGTNLVATLTKPELVAYKPNVANLYSRVQRVPAQNGTIQWPKLTQAAPGTEGAADEFADVGGVLVAWTEEGAEKSEAEPNFEQLSITPYELSAYSELSRTLIGRSVVDVESILDMLFRDAIIQKLDRAILNGNGTGKPTGILQTASIGAPARAVNTQVSYDDLVNMEGAVRPVFRPNGGFIISDSALKYIKKLKDSANKPIFAADASSPMASRIMGYPYIVTEISPALGTAGDVTFGDLSRYICAVEEEVVVAASEHYKFRQGVKAYAVWMKVGGKLSQAGAFAGLAVAAGG